ncbi:MAG TPA: hypothetical protein VOA87_13290 [Thermoanaerobaculia bacterium]|nr:hypothetical protein [Thermoanaerobaculia bacterium]
MAQPFLTAESKRAFTEAVQAVEAVCGAELVIAVRPRSGSYLDAALTAAIGTGLAVLAFLLFSPHPFGLAWFLVDPAVAGALAGMAALRSPRLCRLLTRRAGRRLRVRTAARAVFVDQRIHRTSRRSGILLYISLLEREVEAVVDLGVEAIAATAAFQRAVDEIGNALRRGAGGVAVAAKVRDLAAVLSPALARAAGQTDELTDEVC